MILGVIVKQPADFLDYDISFAKWLIATDALATVTADIVRMDGAALGEKDLEARYVVNNSPIAKLWLAAGIDGVGYKVTLNVTTTAGRMTQAELRVKVKEV
jgi:hypothetical protein